MKEERKRKEEEDKKERVEKKEERVRLEEEEKIRKKKEKMLEGIARAAHERMIVMQAQLEALQKIEEKIVKEEIDKEPWQRKGKYQEKKKKIDWRKGIEKFKKDRKREEKEEQAKREKEEDNVWFEEMKREDKGMEGFWDAMKEKTREEEEKPIVMAMTSKKTNSKRRR